jgi:pyruvate carboxylase subunit B
MIENFWEFGLNEEELLEFAMHPSEYREDKSGKAKEKFAEE